MISHVRGRVAAKAPGFCVIEVGGIGLRLAMTTNSLAALPAEGDEVLVHTRLHVREDELSLFGFESEQEKHAFEHLITVSGVGPKVALAVLSVLSPETLAQAVASDDVALVSSVPGVGKKTAQRIIVDLADKLRALGPAIGADRKTVSGASVVEATEALLAMGFSANEASAAVKGFDGDEGDAQALLRHALKRLGGGS